ncbi:MAG: GNAT family N-acetyltransferase [Deltaproteobacteria bacterium]|nr:GNAT family N-acetyltransferase [Deltaproteobacteria bacterium]
MEPRSSTGPTLPREGWDRLVRPGMAALSYGFLHPCQSTLAGMAWAPLTIDDGEGAPLVRCPAFVHRVTLGQHGPPVLRSAIGRLGVDIMETGNPCAPSAPALSRPGYRWLQALWSHFLAHGRARLLVVRDVLADSSLARELSQRGFARIGERPTFVLELLGSEMSAYLRAMRADYRRRVRRILDLPLEVDVEASFASLAGEMAELFALNAARSSESRVETIELKLIETWSELDASRAITVRDPSSGARCVGLVLVDRPVLHFVRCGFREPAGRQLGLYRRLLYELVRLGYDSGCSYVDFGVTSAEPKLRTGARPVPLQIWARARRSWLQPLVRLAERPRPAMVSRRVFREPLQPDGHWYRPSA